MVIIDVYWCLQKCTHLWSLFFISGYFENSKGSVKYNEAIEFDGGNYLYVFHGTSSSVSIYTEDYCLGLQKNSLKLHIQSPWYTDIAKCYKSDPNTKWSMSFMHNDLLFILIKCIPLYNRDYQRH